MEVGRYNIGEKVWVRISQEPWPADTIFPETNEGLTFVPRCSASVLSANTHILRKQQYSYDEYYRELRPGTEMYLPGKILCKSPCRTFSNNDPNRVGNRIQYCVHVPGMNRFEPEGAIHSNNLEDKVIPSLHGDILSNDCLPGLEVMITEGDPIIPHCRRHGIHTMLCDREKEDCWMHCHHCNGESGWVNKAGIYMVRYVCTIRAMGP